MRYWILMVLLASILAAPAPGRDLLGTTQEIKGTKIALESDAKRLAFTQYVNKMKGAVLANESVHEVKIQKLGYAILGFAKKGETIWEARILTIDGELRGIIMINPQTEAVHFVSGAWEGTTP